MYSFFFLRHSRAASLFFKSLICFFACWSSQPLLEMFDDGATTTIFFLLVISFAIFLRRLTRNEEFLALSVLNNRAPCRRIGHSQRVQILTPLAARYLNGARRNHWNNINTCSNITTCSIIRRCVVSRLITLLQTSNFATKGSRINKLLVSLLLVSCWDVVNKDLVLFELSN